jgi:hypothetical protein
VTQRLEPGDLVLFQIPYSRHTFEYYQDQLLAAPGARPFGDERRIFLPLVAGGTTAPWWADGLYTNAGMTPAEVDRQMADLVAGRRTVWFVASEVALWDERGLVGTWLDEHAQRTLEAVWTRVSVRRYEFP